MKWQLTINDNEIIIHDDDDLSQPERDRRIIFIHRDDTGINVVITTGDGKTVLVQCDTDED